MVVVDGAMVVVVAVPPEEAVIPGKPITGPPGESMMPLLVVFGELGSPEDPIESVAAPWLSVLFPSPE
jgi:hypothetical protein